MKLFDKFLPKIGQFYSKKLPLSYSKFKTKDIIINCRKKDMTTLFDVSQMNYLQISKQNNNVIKKLEYLFPINLEKLKPNKGELTVMLNNECLIQDDFIITNLEDNYRLIINSESTPLFQQTLEDVGLTNNILDKKIVAIQGDGSNEFLNKMGFPIKQKFLENVVFDDIEITRCGYTGMDGFEIIGDEDKLTHYLEKVIDLPNIMMGGLIERDIMRLEAGFCLSGNEFGPNMDIHFNEADLDFIIKKRRRREGGFIGFDNFNKVAEKKRVQFSCNKSLLKHKDIFNKDGDKVGFITSNSFSFSKNKFLGMGYVSIGNEKDMFVKKKDELIKLD